MVDGTEDNADGAATTTPTPWTTHPPAQRRVGQASGAEKPWSTGTGAQSAGGNGPTADGVAANSAVPGRNSSASDNGAAPGPAMTAGTNAPVTGRVSPGSTATTSGQTGAGGTTATAGASGWGSGQGLQPSSAVAQAAPGSSPWSDARGSGSPAPHIDTGQLVKAAPQLLSAAAPMLMMLPMLAASLAGSGSGSGSGSGTSTASPAQQGRDTLAPLQKAYGKGAGNGSGSGNISGPAATHGNRAASGNHTGSGSTAEAIEATRVYQAHVAAAFTALDNTLAAEIRKFAGSHSVDQTQMNALITALDTALVKLGPRALIGAAGQQRTIALIADAVKQAENLAGNTTLSAQAAAQVVDMLANEYLVVLSGQGTVNNTGPSPTGESPAVQAAISVALSEVGKPYVYGAEGPDSFDCSGLTQYAAAAAGVGIPRTAAEQYQNLTKVSPSAIQPGDLIFPAAEFNGGSPEHVIMYIGNGQCVEAPHTGAWVRIVPLPGSFAASRWA